MTVTRVQLDISLLYYNFFPGETKAQFSIPERLYNFIYSLPRRLGNLKSLYLL